MEAFSNVTVRLLSYTMRRGQMRNTNVRASSGQGCSEALIIHFHGGGFVAQSSQSHEIYLRQWAKDLDAPILSVDYSVSPHAIFPTALHECFYVYRWALCNTAMLGTTASRIVVTGDSILKPHSHVMISPPSLLNYNPPSLQHLHPHSN